MPKFRGLFSKRGLTTFLGTTTFLVTNGGAATFFPFPLAFPLTCEGRHYINKNCLHTHTGMYEGRKIKKEQKKVPNEDKI